MNRLESLKKKKKITSIFLGDYNGCLQLGVATSFMFIIFSSDVGMTQIYKEPSKTTAGSYTSQEKLRFKLLN